MTRKYFHQFLRFFISAAVILVVWQIIAMSVSKELIIPYPLAVLSRLGELLVIPDFWLSIGVTLGRVALGFIFGVIFGVIVAFAMYASKIADYLLSPFMKILKTTPVVSFILILLLWFDSDYLPTIISAMMVTPLVWANVITGLQEIDKEYLELAVVYRLSLFSRLKNIYFPAVRYSLLSAALAGVGLAWKSGVTAELLALPKIAIGHELYNAKIYLESPDIFAWTIVIILLSILFENIVTFLGRNAFKGQRHD